MPRESTKVQKNPKKHKIFQFSLIIRIIGNRYYLVFNVIEYITERGIEKQLIKRKSAPGLIPLPPALEECELDCKAVEVMLVQVPIVVKIVPSFVLS